MLGAMPGWVREALAEVSATETRGRRCCRASAGWVREALAEVSAAVELLNQDQTAAITEQAFERAADLRERAEALPQRKAAILRAWRQPQEARPAEPIYGLRSQERAP
jgi:hypothetical protein